MQASINLRALKALCLAASSEETRYYLNGVLVELTADGAIYVATDGLRLMARYEPLDKDDERNTLIGHFIVPMATCKAIKLKAPWTSGMLSDAADGYLRLDNAFTGPLLFKPVDGAFPDWRRVTPNQVDGKPAHFNARYLAEFDKAAELLSDTKHRDSVQTSLQPNGGRPALVQFPYLENTIGVIMPIRSVSTNLDCPSWVHGVAAPATEPAPETVAA